MENHKFGNSSRQKLDTIHDDLVLIFEESLKVSQVDFGVSNGSRTIAKQQQYFNERKSKINPENYSLEKLMQIAKHLVDKDHPKSRAGDIYVYVPGKKELRYDVRYLSYLGGVITSTANRLFNEGRVKHKIRWGYNWDGDEEIGTDQRFQDMPHFELI